MKDLTDRELLDAIDRAMQAVVERFKGKRDAADRARAEEPVPPSSKARPAA